MNPNPRTLNNNASHPKAHNTYWLRRILPLACALALNSAFADPITTASLMREMTDLAGMAEFPNPAYTCKQFSSYDRASKSPSVEWFANGDHGQFLRVEDKDGRKEHVMMDADGPGAIVRIWSANPAGTIRIYLDNAPTPVIEASMTDLLGGKFNVFARPIAGEYSRGWNLYFPIPYAKHCKVTSDKGGFYYHVNYRTYPAGTAMETFKLAQLESLTPEIRKLAAQLDAPSKQNVEGESKTESADLAPGATERIEIPGPAAIAQSVIRVQSQDREAALRGLIVKVTFDGQQTVECPIGDLFGTAPGINAYEALPLQVTKDGTLRSFWFMPFKQSAVIEIENLSKVSASVEATLTCVPHKWSDRSMYFHARWRASFDVPTRPMIDWNYLQTKGQGVFAGVSFAIDNPVKDWWGEGDEKIYVDGETFPSHFGTGTEDYFGYAWCWPGLFTHAYHAQPRCDGPANYGRTSVNRFHIIDRIPFTRDFKFDMELWHWNDKCKVNMAVVSYWYARPGASDTFKPITAAEVVVRPMPEYVIPRVKGAIEGESLPIKQVSGKAEPQDWQDVSAGRHLWWNAGMKVGDTLTVTFPAPKAGKFHVFARFLSAPDYGIHQFSVNGAPAGEPRDFYARSVKLMKEVDLGVFELKPTGNEFTSKVVGKNASAKPGYMLGLDYLLLKPAE